MFSFVINFAQIATALGDVLGMFGTMAAIAEIYLYVEKIPMDGGDVLTDPSLE